MCEVLDRVENRGREEGFRRGRMEGRMEEKHRTTASLYRMGMPEEQIAKAVNVEVDVVKRWLAAL